MDESKADNQVDLMFHLQHALMFHHSELVYWWIDKHLRAFVELQRKTNHFTKLEEEFFQLGENYGDQDGATLLILLDILLFVLVCYDVMF